MRRSYRLGHHLAFSVTRLSPPTLRPARWRSRSRRGQHAAAGRRTSHLLAQGGYQRDAYTDSQNHTRSKRIMVPMIASGVRDLQGCQVDQVGGSLDVVVCGFEILRRAFASPYSALAILDRLSRLHT
jgi:hypothetical protein